MNNETIQFFWGGSWAVFTQANLLFQSTSSKKSGGINMYEPLADTNSNYIWVFPKIVVPPNHPILIGFSIINHPFWGTPIFGNSHIYTWCHELSPCYTSLFCLSTWTSSNAQPVMVDGLPPPWVGVADPSLGFGKVTMGYPTGLLGYHYFLLSQLRDFGQKKPGRWCWYWRCDKDEQHQEKAATWWNYDTRLEIMDDGVCFSCFFLFFQII